MKRHSVPSVVGEFTMAINRGQISIHRYYRRQYDKPVSLILAPGERCIGGIPVGESELKQLDKVLPADAVRGSSYFICRWDRRGRITIPKALLKHAGIKHLVFVALPHFFELWEEEEWAREKAKMEEAFQKLAKES